MFILFTLFERGRREDRVPAGTHGPLCDRLAQKGTAERPQGSRDIPAFPAQWVYGLCRALPGDEFLLASVASRVGDDRPDPVGRRHPRQAWQQQRLPGPHGFAVRGTPSPQLPARSVPLRRSRKSEGRSAPFVMHAVTDSRGSAQSFARPALHIARRRSPRPPHPSPRSRRRTTCPFSG